ncbi:sigma-70 family RNA polymerase sigma factor [Streptomyces sp. NPDC049954]|uniref:sigma-70 family RNA polymerase sigma factor n=1 Tax=Streptomyces sp. NPDC049954 TaxID=3155779 RepID=UPI003435F862
MNCEQPTGRPVRGGPQAADAALAGPVLPGPAVAAPGPVPPARGGGQAVKDRARVLDELRALLEPRRPDLTFDAFADSHLSLWLRYAHTQVGEADADHVVRSVCARLRANWTHVLGQDSVSRYAWRVLKAEIHAWLELHEREPAFVHTSAFLSAVDGLVREEWQEPFDALEDALGLYRVIARLPERQYDLVVLLYVLRAPVEDVADYLGAEVATVRIQARRARRRIATDLGMPARDDRDTGPGRPHAEGGAGR